MFEEGFLQKLKDRYANIHPLIFHRSVEKSTSQTELFDALDTFPTDFPVVWDESERKWNTTKDLFQINKFDFRMEKK